MSLAFIALGSNIGDGCHVLKMAWQQLGNIQGITVLALSSPYMSQPVSKPEWQKDGQDLSGQWFTNAVGLVETTLGPHALLEKTQQVEKNLGRDRNVSVNRTIDLDLLYYNDLILADEDLILPHPEIAKRHFVLLPLAEIAPDHLHPAKHLSTSGMLRALPFAGKDIIFKTTWNKEE